MTKNSVLEKLRVRRLAVIQGKMVCTSILKARYAQVTTTVNKYVQIGHVVLETCEWTDRQTDIPTRLSQYYAPVRETK